jgi:hypothetical protein
MPGIGPYTWDEVKRISNLDVHRVDFASAVEFQWQSSIIWRDRRRDYGELRFLALGYIGTRIHLMVYTPRGGYVRVISLRKANRREVIRYEKGPATNHSGGSRGG